MVEFHGQCRQLRHVDGRREGHGHRKSVGYVAAFSNFDTDGYREHSSALRQVANAKLTFNADRPTHVTMVGNSQYQPETQDPLGLTYAQWQANPRQADPVGDQFNTSKTIRQVQGGAAIDQALGADSTLRLTGYSGDRLIRQYLALTRAEVRRRRAGWSISIAITGAWGCA